MSDSWCWEMEGMLTAVIGNSLAMWRLCKETSAVRIGGMDMNCIIY